MLQGYNNIQQLLLQQLMGALCTPPLLGDSFQAAIIQSNAGDIAATQRSHQLLQW